MKKVVVRGRKGSSVVYACDLGVPPSQDINEAKIYTDEAAARYLVCVWNTNKQGWDWDVIPFVSEVV